MKTLNVVEQLLSGRQDFRDSDKKLIIAVWHLQGLHLTDEQRTTLLEKCATPETITRARRALKHKYPASEAVDNARYSRFKEYRQKYQSILSV